MPTPHMNPTCRRRPHRPISIHAASAARAGFTLVELVLVLAILVILGGVVFTNIAGTSAEAKINLTKTQMNELKNNIQLYAIRMNSLPESLQQLVDGPSDSAKKAKWVAPIIERVPTDGWENELEYSLKGNSYEIRSGGLDGQMNTDDDLTVEGTGV